MTQQFSWMWPGNEWNMSTQILIYECSWHHYLHYLQIKILSVGEWISKVSHVHTAQQQQKRNHWYNMDKVSKINWVKEVSVKKYTVHLFHLHKILEQTKFIYNDSKSRLPRSRRRGSPTKELRQCSECDWIKCDLSCGSLLCTFSKTHQTTPLKWVCFIVCKLYFNRVCFKGKKY